jgi:hypothetical protein
VSSTRFFFSFSVFITGFSKKFSNVYVLHFTLLFEDVVRGMSPWLPFQWVHCWRIEKLLTFWMLIFVFCYFGKTLLDVRVFWQNLLNNISSYHLQTGIVCAQQWANQVISELSLCLLSDVSYGCYN